MPENGLMKVNDLKRDIAINRYEVDAGAVADAIVRKLDLVRRGRQVLLAREAGHSQPPAPVRRRVL